MRIEKTTAVINANNNDNGNYLFNDDNNYSFHVEIALFARRAINGKAII